MAPSSGLEREAGTPAQEAVALKEALVQALAEIETLARRANGEASDMLAFQAAMLSDDELARPAFESVPAGKSACTAWEPAMAAEISGYRAGEDAYFSARAADLEDIRDRVLGHLAPGADGAPIPGGSVVVAADLPLSRFLGIDWAQGGAIVLTEGSPTSHVAMLARARRVPMIVGTRGRCRLDGRPRGAGRRRQRRSGAGSDGGYPHRLRRQGWTRRGRSHQAPRSSVSGRR